MKLSHQNRVNIALIVFAITVVLLMLQSALSLPLRINGFSYTPVQRYTTRFTQLKQSLPSSSSFGYLSNSGTNLNLSQANDLAEFYLTQYALSPFLVANSIKPEYIIGNFHKNPIPQIKSNHLIVVKDFGKGVLLLRHSSK